MSKKNKELVRVCQENPSLPLVLATYYEVVCDDWGYWKGDVEKIKVDYYTDKLVEERWYVGEEDIRLKVRGFLENEEKYESVEGEDFEKLIDQKFNEMVEKGDIYKAVIVFIGI